MTVTPYGLSIFRSLFEGITEEMGGALARSAFSPNIRERLDFSCALFDASGQLLAQAAHIPVHLGSMPLLVQHLAATEEVAPGDVLAANDPFAGGTHLPDVTLVSPLYVGGRLFGFAAARAHHADVGGMSPGSMPLSREIFQEGLILPPVRLVRRGRRQRDVWRILLRNVRSPEEREGDLLAQTAALRLAARRLDEVVARYGEEGTRRHLQALLDYSERLVRQALGQLPRGQAVFEDVLEEGEKLLALRVRVELAPDEAVCDFEGTARAEGSCLNAPYPVTCAAVYYCFACLFGEHIPPNQGAFRPLRVEAPPGSLVNAAFPSAVAAGNVETSQRVVDVVFGALARLLPERIPAASAGTMNNLAVGGSGFTYYETMGGGCGGGPEGPGESGSQVHMTNTRNTPAEVLETSYPLRLLRYQLRQGSGGAGRHAGGEGLRRDLQLLAPATVSLLAQRRRTAPFGLQGGGEGAPGEDLARLPGGRTLRLPGQFTRVFPAGTILSIRSPGGGGWGRPEGGGEPPRADQTRRKGGQTRTSC
jgi:N-methylhydantoinase B